MSGGSMDYVYAKFTDVGESLLNTSKTPLRKALGKLILKVADALHDIEWVDSGDYMPGDELEAIRQCFDNPRVREHEVLAEELAELTKKIENLMKG